MQELDAFEKYLHEQLKGHSVPHELMWKRLQDAVGKPKAWYQKSLVKYALTAITAATIGASSSYFLLNKSTIDETNQSKIQPVLAPKFKAQKTDLTQQKIQASIQASTEPLNTVILSTALTSTPTKLVDSQNDVALEQTSQNTTNLNFPTTASIACEKVLPSAEAFEQGVSDLTSKDPNSLLVSRLQPLSPTQVKMAKQSVIPPIIRPKNIGGFSIQIANNKSINALNNLTIPSYALNSSAIYSSAVLTQQKPTLQLQYHFPKAWFVGIGVAHQQIELTENFTKINVFSYDDQEHYWFNYAFGQRKISDEELEDGPWPDPFPNPPFGSDTSHVHTNYTSEVQMKLLQIPLTFGYEKRIGNFGIQLSSGLRFSYMTSATQRLNIPGFNPSIVNISQQLQKWSWSQLSTLRLEYYANQHLGLFIEPSYVTQLSSYQSKSGQGMKLNQMQFHTGLSWKF